LLVLKRQSNFDSTASHREESVSRMTSEEFKAEYRLGDQITTGKVESFRGQDSSGEEVLVHFLVGDRPGSRTSLLNYLPKLDSTHAAQIRLLVEVDQVAVMVTDPLETFTSLEEWLVGAAGGRTTHDPGVYTRILGNLGQTEDFPGATVVNPVTSDASPPESESPDLGATAVVDTGSLLDAAGDEDEGPDLGATAVVDTGGFLDAAAPEEDSPELGQTAVVDTGALDLDAEEGPSEPAEEAPPEVGEAPPEVEEAPPEAEAATEPEPEPIPPAGPEKTQGPPPKKARGRPGAYTMVFGEGHGLREASPEDIPALAETRITPTSGENAGASPPDSEADASPPTPGTADPAPKPAPKKEEPEFAATRITPVSGNRVVPPPEASPSSEAATPPPAPAPPGPSKPAEPASSPRAPARPAPAPAKATMSPVMVWVLVIAALIVGVVLGVVLLG
jgi:hypothetical protein